jgi:type IX secretion system substrate protein/BD-FAE protein
MKKNLLPYLICVILFSLPVMVSAQRYLTEMFPTVNITTNITYGTNISVFPPPTPASIPLVMDVYEPAGDVLPQRPLIIFIHTGSFLPRYINGSPIGSRNDSATVEICTQLARRGYVVANMDYRLGWNPAGSNVDIRKGTILQAIYRAIQDAKACVRYFRSDAAAGNTYGIDANSIILGGQGTGGYIALNYACLDDPAEITIPKFISGITDPTYGFVAGQPFVDQAVLGDYDGFGGIPQMNNPNNSPGFPNDVSFVFNLGGALGDSTWIEPGDAPMVGFHLIGDPFAPYDVGTVFVPGNPPQAVVDVVGAKTIIRLANQYGNNACFANAGFNDPYTQAANQLNDGFEGLYPFATVPAVQSGPWEWYDSLTVVNEAAQVGQNGTLIYTNALLTNPDMSKTKALTYIDTIMNYLNPRIVECLNLPTGINEFDNINAQILISPNPATNQFTIDFSELVSPIHHVEIVDITGKIVYQNNSVTEKYLIVNRNGIASGVYITKVYLKDATVEQKIIFQ